MCKLRQEFVIGGFSRVKGAETGIRSWLLGVHERDGSLRFAGTAKPQLRPSQITALQRKASALVEKTSPFYNPPKPEKDRRSVWLEPQLVAGSLLSNGRRPAKFAILSSTACATTSQPTP